MTKKSNRITHKFLGADITVVEQKHPNVKIKLKKNEMRYGNITLEFLPSKGDPIGKVKF